MPTRRQLLTGLLAVVAGSGCGPGWTVLEAPSRWLGGAMGLAPLRFDGALIDGKAEPALRAELDDEDRDEWETQKAALREAFAERFVERAGDGGLAMVPLDAAVVTLVPTVRRIETGVFVGVSGQPSEVQIEVKAMTVDGAILARVLFEHGTPSSMRFRSLSRRLRHDGEAIAEEVARYVVSWRDSAVSSATSAGLSTLPSAFLGSSSTTAHRRGIL